MSYFYRSHGYSLLAAAVVSVWVCVCVYNILINCLTNYSLGSPISPTEIERWKFMICYRFFFIHNTEFSANFFFKSSKTFEFFSRKFYAINWNISIPFQVNLIILIMIGKVSIYQNGLVKVVLSFEIRVSWLEQKPIS